MHVPLFDMTRQYDTLKSEILQAIDGVFRSGKLIMGENVKQFEREVCDYLNVKHAIGVGNGSDALYIAAKAIGIGDGDYVITTPFTFFATVSCITRNGAVPVFADIDRKSFNIDLDRVEEILTTHPNREKIKAVIPVHLFGRTVDLERLEKIKRNYGVKILEDCAQSIGSEWVYSDGTIRKSGTVGDASILSFFPTKNLGAYGDGGMILTNNDDTNDFCRVFRVHGAKVKYFHEMEGINSRLDEIQAAVLRIKLKYLDEYHEKRIKIARNYTEMINSLSIEFLETPRVTGDFTCIFHQYVVRVKAGHRDRLREYLKTRGVETAVYYPLGMHRQKCFSRFGSKILENTDQACQEVLALPIFPEISITEVEYVVKCIGEYFKEARKC